jgi:putative endonuclease
MTKSYWVYVLKSKMDGRHYVGSGKDVSERLRRHNVGDYKYTKGHRPWNLVYKEEVRSKSESIKKERFFKTGVGREILKKLLTGT